MDSTAAGGHKSATELRRRIKKLFSSRPLYLDEQALDYLVDQLTSLGGDRKQHQKVMERVMQLVEQKGVEFELLDLVCLKAILHEVNRQKKNESETLFKLENVVEWRRSIVEDRRRTSHHLVDSVGQSPWDKLSFDAYRQRFELIRMLVVQDVKHFDPIDSLLAHRGSKVCLLAQLFRGTDGHFVAEDFSGCVRLHLGASTYEDGLYFEGGTYVFDGICSSDGNRLDVDRVTLPPVKQLSLCEAAVDGDERCAMRTELGRGSRGDPNDRIVLMSDVYLDDDRSMKALYHLLQGFSSSPPNIFVFCGRFLSIQRAHGYMDQAATAFRHFANILSEFSDKYCNTEFVPALLPVLQKCFKDAKNVHFAPNPCKLIFKDRHIVIYRDDMVEKLCRSAVFMPKNAKPSSIPKLFCDTIWAQRHFSPLPLFTNPIQPHFDPLFQLFPAPDALVIADRFNAFVESANDQRQLTLNPGPFSLGTHFEFQVYYPTLQRVEHSAYHEENSS
uniref:DNA polymerase epsilon subunit n=1 Tax=Globodera pallida TaxID=36090 RepID=A0A183C6Q4_GLOPA